MSARVSWRQRGRLAALGWAGACLLLALTVGSAWLAAAAWAGTSTTVAVPTGTPTPAPQPTTATPTVTSTPTPTSPAVTTSPATSAPTATATVTAPTVTVTATVTQQAANPPPEPPGNPPAVQHSAISRATAVLAVVVLALSALVLWLVHRRASPRPPGHLPAPVQPARLDVRAEEGLTTMLVELGEAMVDAGYPVTDVQDVLNRVAQAGGIPDAEIIVLPTALLVSLPGQVAVETAAATAGRSPLRFDQIDAVARVAAAAGAGDLRPMEAREQLHLIRDQPAPFGPGTRTLGYVLLSAGLTLILRGSMVDLAVAAGLGALVGTVLLATSGLRPALRAVLPFGCAFGVALAVFLLSRTSLDVGILGPLVGPLITFLPGALLTISVLELATGQMISGAGRLAAGILQLLMLALGFVAAAQLVGVPATSVGSLAAQPLGDLAPWLGVAVFGVGVVMNQCALPSTTWWILLVLYVAYGAQIIGGLFFGAELSAFVGAVTMTPVATYVAGRPTGPATQVSFLPAFWLLVPGALGLVGVTMLLGEDRSNAFTSLVTTAVTMIAISFGVLIGRGMSLRRQREPGAAR